MAVSIRGPVLTAALASCLLGACSPTFNWRELRADGAPLVALMPCKPETATRPVPMLGEPTELHMHSCEAGGLTFAVAWAKLDDATKAAEALEQWQAASLASIRVVPGASTGWVMALPGATRVQGVKAQGSDHLGQPLQTQAVYFAQGGWVYQAAVYGPKLPEQATTAFFDGLNLP
ncbi:hypothetical protein LPB72_08945 [Hydrogenophaga crassostreae]|uniref:Uncharacterized protein n=1 Tax=Hydrogenophaga crassostreae TaxID=1763535 RepID=A0A167I8B9_9BURK|nr:hypothetical protein [Hydrogenophaga crassostreae]AOW11819.1 hypothetical protein LPB072_02005 [Hydrogenophaga crassostreae]OAD42333.1 hypothetical protein LPB72_08945 [Hydrogenophaga crassostreae]